jgi:Protein-tyrosine-phosphatase
MRVLMVCLGNICRSPLAQGILEHKMREHNLDWEIDSAGTGAYHIGDLPDPRSISKAQEHGIDITDQRARRIVPRDLAYYDHILAMDTANYRDIVQMDINKDYLDKIKMVLNYVYPKQNMPVPDPYYDDSFQNVYELLSKAMDAFIDHHK